MSIESRRVEMNIKTKRTLCLLIGIASILTIVSTVSYAYFTGMSDAKPIEASLSTARVSAKFTDNDNGISGELNFGESITKKFIIENTGTADAYVKMYWVDLINTYLEESLTYTLSYSENEAGPYTEVVNKTNVPQSNNPSKKELANSLTIPYGKTYYYELEITLNYQDLVNQNSDLKAIFNSRFSLEDINYKEPTPIEKTLAVLNVESQGVRTSFDEPALTDEGVFEMEDDYGTSYYYRGAVKKNYVYFAGFYWRIIRVNGDGSLRIIYDGTTPHANGESSTDRVTSTSQKFNGNYTDNKYVGWMYGPEGTTGSTSKEEIQSNLESSTIKTVVDQWYVDNIVTPGYGDAVADVQFCNDRSTPGTEETGWSSDTGLGYGKNYTAFGANARFLNSNREKTNIQPTFKCPEQADAFTVSDTEKGNGSLDYPVGLITADEVVAAGSGKYNTSNSSYYLYKDSSYWSLSPYNYSGFVYVFRVNNTGNLISSGTNSTGAVAPVINLSAEYVSTLVGDGTMENPYREVGVEA